MSDGGPAFPFDGSVEDGEIVPRSKGMSLRDWFAAHALTGILAYPGGDRSGSCTEHQVAKAAYLYADAMLASREKKATDQ